MKRIVGGLVSASLNQPSRLILLTAKGLLTDTILLTEKDLLTERSRRQQKVTVLEWVEGFYEEKVYTGDEQIVSPLLGNLELSTVRVLQGR